MSVNLQALPKGYRFPSSDFELSPQWVRRYVAAVEDEVIGSLGPGLVPPMAVAALAIGALFDGARLAPGAIHLGQELAFLRPLRVGDRLSASARVASRGERQSWVLVGIDLTVKDDSQIPVMTGRAVVTMPLSTDPEPES